jgi:hypothetical protein
MSVAISHKYIYDTSSYAFTQVACCNDDKNYLKIKHRESHMEDEGRPLTKKELPEALVLVIQPLAGETGQIITRMDWFRKMDWFNAPTYGGQPATAFSFATFLFPLKRKVVP